MVEYGLPKAETRVRFPSPAPLIINDLQSSAVNRDGLYTNGSLLKKNIFRGWPSFYPGVEHLQLLDGYESLRLGTQFETNLAGQNVFASVQEFEPMTRIA
jgi:hypothetical protein